MLTVSPGCSRQRRCSRWRASCGKPGCLDRLRRAQLDAAALAMMSPVGIAPPRLGWTGPCAPLRTVTTGPSRGAISAVICARVSVCRDAVHAAPSWVIWALPRRPADRLVAVWGKQASAYSLASTGWWGGPCDGLGEGTTGERRDQGDAGGADSGWRRWSATRSSRRRPSPAFLQIVRAGRPGIGV